MPLLWDHGLEPGDRLGGSLFPQVWPHALEAEVARRMQGPESPSPTAIGAFMDQLEATGFGPKSRRE